MTELYEPRQTRPNRSSRNFGPVEVDLVSSFRFWVPGSGFQVLDTGFPGFRFFGFQVFRVFGF